MREFRSDLPLFIAAFRDKPFSHKRLQGFCKIGLGSATRNHVTEPDTPARVTDTFPKLHHLLERPTNQPAASFVQRLEQFLCPECEGTTHTLQRIQSVVFAPCLPKPFPDSVERELQQGQTGILSLDFPEHPTHGRPCKRPPGHSRRLGDRRTKLALAHHRRNLMAGSNRAVHLWELCRHTEKVAAQCKQDNNLTVWLRRSVHQRPNEYRTFSERPFRCTRVLRMGWLAERPGLLELINQDD